MLLRAVSDDSLSQFGEKRLFLAGYLNDASKWSLFQDAWAEELAAAPSINYLKMVEAQNLRGQFRYWTADDRDAKIVSLARVIRHFRPMSFDVSVSVESFNALVKPKAPYGLETPYFSCLFGVVSSVAKSVHKLGPKAPIDFIFDEQSGVSIDFQNSFHFMIQNIPKGPRSLINGNPKFMDDKNYSPLQAADMLAWHLRREHEDGFSPFDTPMVSRIVGERHISLRIPHKTLCEWGEFFGQQEGVALLKSKPQWRKFRSNLSAQLAAGYIPPHGTRWKNFIAHLRENFSKIIGR